MTRRRRDHWSLMVACNDWRNGAFAHRARAFTFCGPDGDSAISFDDGNSYKFKEVPGAIRIGRITVPTLWQSEWVGNWCWNSYGLADEQAARLLGILWRRYRSAESGWCALIDRLEAGHDITPNLLREVLLAVEEEARAYFAAKGGQGS